MKKLVSLFIALVLTLTCVAALADTTYTHFFATEDLAGITDLNGFITGSGMTEYNTLILKDDGTYEYIKLVGTITEEGEVVDNETENGTLRYETRYVYTGTYTLQDDQATLNTPDECVFSENWGILETMGYLKSSEGTASNGDRVTNYEGTDYDPMDNFSNPVYKFSGHDTPVSVTLNADGTFTYNAAASSDDD
ncbi:MAG: hypothetical protein IJ865_07535 [Clostridia bacterium]|nr:hypothetical protein [Clostridia bacterium]